jgi:hypothetical protein
VVKWRTVRRAESPSDARPASSLVLNRNGSVAWMRQEEGVVSVRKSDSDGEGVVLDRDQSLVGGSLALAESRLYWSRSSEVRSAQLR